jgi:undecaprenyl-phosphate 4-deoxy-4-formamido-L-arabinose transferase
VPGYASTIIAVLILGGMQLLSLGVMGEYLGRLHLNVNRKPQYVVRHALGPSPDARPPEGRGPQPQ